MMKMLPVIILTWCMLFVTNFVDDPDRFKSLLKEAEQPLYLDCTKFTKLPSLVKLYNLKSKYGFSDTSFFELLKLLHQMLPSDNVLPIFKYSVKEKIICIGYGL